jgi:hypothetical protein
LTLHAFAGPAARLDRHSTPPPPCSPAWQISDIRNYLQPLIGPADVGPNLAHIRPMCWRDEDSEPSALAKDALSGPKVVTQGALTIR